MVVGPLVVREPETSQTVAKVSGRMRSQRVERVTDGVPNRKAHSAPQLRTWFSLYAMQSVMMLFTYMAKINRIVGSTIYPEDMGTKRGSLFLESSVVLYQYSQCPLHVTQGDR